MPGDNKITNGRTNPIHVWVNPPNTPLPLAQPPIRFAVGTPSGNSTNSWRVWTHGLDTYVACRDNFREIKVSLHASNRWRIGYTEEFVNSRPEVLSAGEDRAWKKWTPNFGDGKQYAVGLQFIAPRASLYLEPNIRGSWPNSVAFVDPPQDPMQMTVVSVAVVLGNNRLIGKPGSTGGVFGKLPLGPDKNIQLVAMHENAEDLTAKIEDAYYKAMKQPGGPEKLPRQGVFFVHGERGKEVPWIAAVPVKEYLSDRID